MLTILLMAGATASISFTMGPRTPVFDWLRDLIDETNLADAGPAEHWLTRQLGDLMRCPYCISHWVAFLLTIIFHPMPITGTVFDLPVVAFFVVTVACLLIQTISILSYLASILKHLSEMDLLDFRPPSVFNLRVEGEPPPTATPPVEPTGEAPVAASESPAGGGAQAPAPAGAPVDEQPQLP